MKRETARLSLKRETSNLLQLHDHDLDRQGSHGRGSGRHHFVQVQFELLALRAKDLKEIAGNSGCSLRVRTVCTNSGIHSYMARRQPRCEQSRI